MAGKKKAPSKETVEASPKRSQAALEAENAQLREALIVAMRERDELETALRVLQRLKAP